MSQMAYKCLPITGKKNDSFVGIKADRDNIYIYYPESLELSLEEGRRRREILSLVKSISLARTKYGEETHIFEAKNIGKNFVVDAYIWILNDYLRNGTYINLEKEYVDNARGKINWKRTLRKPAIVSENNIIYKEYVTEVKHQRDNLLTEIYKYCVRTASDAIGWLIGVTTDVYERVPFNKREYENSLRKELEQTFDDEKRYRLTVMLEIVTESSSGDDFSGGFIYGVNDYSYIFERMIDSLYGNVPRIQDYYPNGEWDLKCFDDAVTSSNLRPDTVVDMKNNIFILDAKFYRFGVTMEKQDLPNTSSIQKQVTYGEYISRISNGESVISAFLLPYNKNSNPFHYSSDVEFVGTATAKWKQQNHSFEKVQTFLIDMHFLLLSWDKKNSSYRSELVNMMLENSK